MYKHFKDALLLVKFLENSGPGFANTSPASRICKVMG